MKPNMLVSVVTATYNMAKYVVLAVESVLQQTYPNIEIIVVNDGSEDNTTEVMDKFRSDQRVKYLPQKENKGQTVAKNIGINASKGKFVAFVDADNLWKPDKLEKQLPLFDKSERTGVVYSDAEYIDGDGKILPYIKRDYYSGNITENLLLHNFINFNSAVIKRECINQIGIFDESLSMGIDWDLWLRISTKYEFAFLDYKTYCYRIWPNQMSHNKLMRLQNAEKIVEKFLKKHQSLVSSRIVNKCWAHIYADYGFTHAQQGEKIKALKYYIKSISKQPRHVSAWKNIIKLMLVK